MDKYVNFELAQEIQYFKKIILKIKRRLKMRFFYFYITLS